MGSSYSVEQVPDMAGKVAIVTGANTGIGKITALELARKGCSVVLACRSKEKTEPVVEEIKRQTNNENVEFSELDLASLRSVEAFAQRYRESDRPLHLLVNNAGVMATPYRLTADGVEMQFGTNHLGHFLLTTRLLDVLERNAPSRIVNLSSAAHSFPYSEGVRFDRINDEASYSPWRAYGQSKLCNILFTKELARRVEDKQIFVNAVHPGYVETELTRNVPDLYGGVGSVLSTVSGTLFAKSPENGALTSIYVATSPDIETKNYRGLYFVPTAKLSKGSAHSNNAELATRLWEFSENLIREKLEGGTEEEGTSAEGEEKSGEKKKETEGDGEAGEEDKGKEK